VRNPVPANKLVAFTLAGALLTTVVAGALAAPIDGITQSGGQTDQSSTAPDAAPQIAQDAPTPNQDFTPAVQTRSGYEDEDHEEYEEGHEEYEEYHEEHEEEEHEEQEGDYEGEEADEED